MDFMLLFLIIDDRLSGLFKTGKRLLMKKFMFIRIGIYLSLFFVICSNLEAKKADIGTLNGNGDVKRVLATYNDLMTGTDPQKSPVDNSAFALPKDAAMPDCRFEGTLELLDEDTGGTALVLKDIELEDKGILDPQDIDLNTIDTEYLKWLHLPEFKFEFIQEGSYLIPKQRGLITSDKPYWEYIIGPGRVWKEKSDNGWCRASFPFALVQKNQNATHNGVMMFLFNGKEVSRVWYQISKETNVYYQTNMWGLLKARYQKHKVPGADRVVSNFKSEIANRMSTKPIETLSKDLPGINPAVFSQSPPIAHENMTLYGLAMNGVNYVGGFDTRYGKYPYPEYMIVPSYSISKSVFAALGLMYLEKKYKGAFNEKITNWVPETVGNEAWKNVTFANCLDMTTGHYEISTIVADENKMTIIKGPFFNDTTHKQKLNFACNKFSNKATPGTKVIYHTIDTYVLGTAMQAFFRSKAGKDKDIFNDIIVKEIFKPLNMSPESQTCLRTRDDVKQPFVGYGLFFTADDVAKIMIFMNNDNGKINGRELLDPEHLSIALQRNPENTPLEYSGGYGYQHGFWTYNIAPLLNLDCGKNLWIPLGEGVSGNVIMPMANGLNYYYFSDNKQYIYEEVAKAVHKVKPLCVKQTITPAASDEGFNIEIKEVAGQTLLISIDELTSLNQVPVLAGKRIAELYALAGTENIELAGPSKVKYIFNPNNPADTKFNMECSFPVKTGTSYRGEFFCVDAAPYKCASYKYRGAAGNALSEAWQQFLAAVKAKGLKTIPTQHEIYIKWVGPASPSNIIELQCEIRQ
jgi:CubicO group peptidase (beta-lactamase class C family)